MEILNLYETVKADHASEILCSLLDSESVQLGVISLKRFLKKSPSKLASIWSQ